MTYWQFDALVLVLPVALLLWGQVPAASLVRAAAALTAVALLWTAPWDEHLVQTGVWTYPAERVLARVGSVPVEEYAFVALEVLLVAAWGARTGRLPGRSGAGSPRLAVRPEAGALSPAWRSALPWVVLTLVGAVLAALGGQGRYLGLLLVWAGPPLVVQRLVAGDLLRARRRDRWVVAAPVVVWLCAVDRLALAEGIWSISPAASTGLNAWGLPLEEALFFTLTGLLVTDALVLATDPTALGRARRLLGAVLRAPERERVPAPPAAVRARVRRTAPRAPGPRRPPRTAVR